MNHKADQGSGRILGNIDFFDLECINRKDIAVRLISFWRACTAESTDPIIRSALNSARRQQFAGYIAGIRRQFGDICRDIVDDPMPPARSRRRIRVIHRNCIAFCTRWTRRPLQRRGLILPRAPESVKYLLPGKKSTRLDCGTCKRKAAGKDRRCSQAKNDNQQQPCMLFIGNLLSFGHSPLDMNTRGSPAWNLIGTPAIVLIPVLPHIL